MARTEHIFRNYVRNREHYDKHKSYIADSVLSRDPTVSPVCRWPIWGGQMAMRWMRSSVRSRWNVGRSTWTPRQGRWTWRG